MSRPKIHRLPSSVVRAPVRKAPHPLVGYAPYIAGGAVVMALLAAIPPQPRLPEAASQHEAALLPQISVTPQEAVTAGVAKSNEKMAVSQQEQTVAPPVQVQELALNTSAALVDTRRGDTIILQGQNEQIIGQMARIPMENEQITEIRPASDVDNGAGRELLSIISKY